MNLQNQCSMYEIWNLFAWVLETMYGGILDHKLFCFFRSAFRVDRVICILPVIISLHILPSLHACIQNWGKKLPQKTTSFERRDNTIFSSSHYCITVFLHFFSPLRVWGFFGIYGVIELYNLFQYLLQDIPCFVFKQLTWHHRYPLVSQTFYLFRDQKEAINYTNRIFKK